MGKMAKAGVNEKVQDARDRKAGAKKAAADAAAKAKDDAYWDVHANPKAKRDQKREDQERQREEAAKKKAEAKRLAAEEEAALAAAGKKKASKPAPPKVTAAQLASMREREQREMEQQAATQQAAQRRMVSEDQYAAAVQVENRNREDVGVEARSMDAALQALTLDKQEVDRHPEKRAKAAWEAYYEEQLAQLKEEKPGLRLMQYKSQIFERWQRDPRNPRNQKADA
ncbi:coiled-coil domain-containing 124 [Chlorella sorokiniana]|uniref:Coiled-coil domain-containing 124 n=1 Tax=Chlorella sorokiniana TaxID=3076 RepID=A0A2P6U4J5_CHLSO|nr:coiled-coil domain-containing 124 [Chlorella sorokiniana]|eukprot:PRW61227.1 coiled-coil domain-containing 124 [Chlorella sorokiniana]